MNRLLSILLLLFIYLASPIICLAQDNKQIEIPYSGFLTFDEINYPGAKILTRDNSKQIHIIHDNINLWCDKAVHYSEEKFIEAYGNVRMTQGDTISMTAKYIEYSGKTLLAFASGNVLLSTPNSKVTTDTLYFDRNKQQAFYKSGGKVVKESSGTITSDIGRYYMEAKKFQFVNDVVLINEQAKINTNYADFYEDSGHAYLFGPSTIKTKDSKTYCEKGFYDTGRKIGYAVKKSRIDYDERIIEGDSLFFDNKTNFASASNHIKITDTINNSIVKGHYAEVYRSKEKDSVFITKRALAITVQENDSIYMHAERLTVTGKPDHRIVKAYYNAKIYKSDISAKADSIYADQKTGITKLININRFSNNDAFSIKRKPILWNIENQMTGDTIHLISNPKTEKLDSLLVFDNAFIISKDTLSTNGYNQISGKQLIGRFNDENKLRHVDINKNAQSIFYARNENQELIGIDKGKSASVSIIFDNGDIEEYSRYNQIDGSLFPSSQFPERDKLLKGFDWRNDERPKSVDDLFIDDAALELPKIKGLDDYVPQEDFFDNQLMERVNKANEEVNTVNETEKKASRNLPQNVKNNSPVLNSNTTKKRGLKRLSPKVISHQK